jgi:uncharacterized phage protein (TIGR02218 family)
LSKNVPAPLQAHLDTGATTLAMCWKVTRKDGLVQGFTEHDRDLTFGSPLVTYLASSGFTASQITESLGLSVDNLNIDGAISSTTINEDDLASGRYDDAEVELILVNWADTSQRITRARGSIGEVKRQETAFSTEFRSLVHRLNQRTGRTYQRTCDAVLGDTRCKVDLNTTTYRGLGTVSAASGRVLTVSGLGSYTPGFFANGRVKFTSGSNNNLTFEVKFHPTTGSLTLWNIPPGTVLTGDTFEVRAGCGNTFEICKAKFNNVVNFQGFPYIPGQDGLTTVPVPGTDTFDGGSLFGN